MTVTRFRDEDHAMIAEWWTRQGWPVIPLHLLSTTGYIIWDDETTTPLCAGWLYIQNSSWGLVEWIVSNPDAGIKKKAAAIRFLVSHLKEVGASVGNPILFTFTKQRGLRKTLERAGFKVSDENMTHLVISNGEAGT